MSKKVWFASVPSVMFMTTMFVSSTFAWFTDFAVNSGNRVQSGNLAVGFAASDALENGNLVGTVQDLKLDSDPVFNLGNAAQPGDSQERYLRIRNEGNIAINYQVDFAVTVDSRLAEVILFEIQPLGGQTITIPGTEIDQDVYISLQDNQEFTGGLLRENSETRQEFEIWRVKMLYSPSAGNQYNDASLVFEVDIQLNAWQFNKPSSSEVLDILNIEDFIDNIGDNYSIKFEYEEFNVLENRSSDKAIFSLKRDGLKIYEENFDPIHQNDYRYKKFYDYRNPDQLFKIEYSQFVDSEPTFSDYAVIDSIEENHFSLTPFYTDNLFDVELLEEVMFESNEENIYTFNPLYKSVVFNPYFDYLETISFTLIKENNAIELKYEGRYFYGENTEMKGIMNLKFFNINTTRVDIPFYSL